MISPLTERIRAAAKAGRPAVIPFLPGGYPNSAAFLEALRAMDDAGADVIEVGMPFSDPVADGPTVEAASLCCIEAGVTLGSLLADLGELQAGRPLKAPLVLMGYLNPLLSYGLTNFAVEAARAGVRGCILADLPLEESARVRELLARHGIDLIPLIGLNTPYRRMAAYADVSRGFAYFVSMMGTTGGDITEVDAVRQGLDRAATAFDIPVALGFGLSAPADFDPFRSHAQAAVIGSALIRHIDAGGDAGAFVREWVEKA